MNIEELTKPLSIDEIDFRIQSINRGGYATILAYKDARVDINRLNKAVGQGNWQRKHEMIGDRLYCSIGIFNGRDSRIRKRRRVRQAIHSNAPHSTLA